MSEEPLFYTDNGRADQEGEKHMTNYAPLMQSRVERDFWLSHIEYLHRDIARILKALDKAKEAARAVGCSEREIGGRLGMSEDAIRMKVKRKGKV